MKYLLRFLLVYIVVLFSIFSFYFTTTQKYYRDLELLSKELKGLEYLKNLYLFTNNLIEYKFEVDLQKSRDGLESFEAEISGEITSLKNFRKDNFNFYNDALSKELTKVTTFTYSDSEFYELLELINNESYRVGDKAGLFFQTDRKVYYLNSLLTHYLPEYIMSLSIIKHITEYHLLNGSISDAQRYVYIEQNKLVFLSMSELSTIIAFLEPYKDTNNIQETMEKIRVGLENLPDKKENLSEYLDRLTTVFLYSDRLNTATVKDLENFYNEKENNVNEKITFYNLLLLFLFLFITILFVYFKLLFDSNRKKEKSIQQLNETLDKLVVFFKTDADGYVTNVSHAFLKLSGFSEKNFIGKISKIFKNKKSTGLEKWSIEERYESQDGSYYWLQLTVVPEINEKGDTTAFMVYGVDITYQKKIEEEKEKTQAALSFKSKFLSNMSHEIRTPLNGIIGFTEIALKTELNKYQKDLMFKIKSTSDLLLGIINDILDISKIESGKMTIEKVDFDLKELVKNVVNILMPVAQEKKIELQVEYVNMESFYYIGDALRISQVLTNLLSNAIKFTSKGYVKIIIKVQKDKQLYFEVVDSGIGLKEESLKSLFEEFTQADMSTSRKYGGTGLGLSICKNLVDLMGGEITVSSEFGKGSSFSFVLPLEKSEKYMALQAEIVEDFELVEKKVEALTHKSILVAEDNKMNQMVLSMLLEDTQLDIDFANDGEIAVKKFQEKAYDMILMDLQMPNLDGYEATKAIRERDKEIPIIALSANVLQEDIDRAYAAGMNDYLLKPIDTQKLYRVFLRYIKE